MKERTEIDTQNLHFAYMELASCKVYDDAKLLLDELVIKEIGREYGDNYYFDEETDEWLCEEIKYKNSQVPRIVKLAVIDSITDFLNSRELISEEATIAYEKAKVKDTTIIPFKRMDDDAKKVRNWVDRWKKEPAPIIGEEKTIRLVPTELGKTYAPLMYAHLTNIGYIDVNEQSWNYLCGLTDTADNIEPIKWCKDLFPLKVLIDSFFKSETYFIVKRGALSFMYDMLADKEGCKINRKSCESIINNKMNDKKTSKGETREREIEEWQKMKVNGMF